MFENVLLLGFILKKSQKLYEVKHVSLGQNSIANLFNTGQKVSQK